MWPRAITPEPMQALLPGCDKCQSRRVAVTSPRPPGRMGQPHLKRVGQFQQTPDTLRHSITVFSPVTVHRTPTVEARFCNLPDFGRAAGPGP
jgi:hypothetical protein